MNRKHAPVPCPAVSRPRFPMSRPRSSICPGGIVGLVLVLFLGLSLLPAPTAHADEPEAAPGTVQVRTEPLTLPWHTSTPVYLEEPNNRRALYPVRDSRRPDGERTFETVILENDHLLVQIIPEAGGVIARAIDKATGADLFFFEEKAKDYLPWWESGVKMSFPFFEHGLGMEQPASWIVVEDPDGGKSIAMWMEFSRHNEAYHRFRYGRYTSLLLTQRVTLAPDAAAFTITYAIQNPTPYRQGRRFWNDTFFPRNHFNEEGVIHGANEPPARKSPSRWIFPTAFASDHWGHAFGSYPPAHNRIGQRDDGTNFSVFAWNPTSGMTGVHYPEVDVNRLRITDPRLAPGAKQWYVAERPWNPERPNHMYNFLELWGGTDHVFEGIEHWLDPGERFALWYTYTLVQGIGEAQYANPAAAVRLDPEEETLHIAALLGMKTVQVLVDDADLGTHDLAPHAPLALKLPPGTQQARIRLVQGDTPLLDQTLPLQLCTDTTHHPAISASMVRGAQHSEMGGNADEHGNTARKAISEYPGGSLGRGRVLYRDGQLDNAKADLEAYLLSNPGSGEAWHLLGALLLEEGEQESADAAFEQALTVDDPYVAAHYFLALSRLRAEDTEGTKTHLQTLLATAPHHWDAKLLAASLAPDTDAALLLTREDPASIRAWVVLQSVAERTGDPDTSAMAGERVERLKTEPGAEARLAEFRDILQGVYRHPARLQR